MSAGALLGGVWGGCATLRQRERNYCAWSLLLQWPPPNRFRAYMANYECTATSRANKAGDCVFARASGSWLKGY